MLTFKFTTNVFQLKERIIEMQTFLLFNYALKASINAEIYIRDRSQMKLALKKDLSIESIAIEFNSAKFAIDQSLIKVTVEQTI